MRILLTAVIALVLVGCTAGAPDASPADPERPQTAALVPEQAADATPTVETVPTDPSDVTAPPPRVASTAADTVTPTVQPLSALSTAAVQAADTAQARVSVTVIDLRAGLSYSFGSDESYRMASIGKVPLMLAVLGAEPTALDRSQLATMITWSDNELAAALWTHVGGLSTVSEVWAHAVGPNAVPTREHWGGGETTADAFAQLLAAIATGETLDAMVAADAGALLEAVAPAQAWGVSAGAPAGVTMAVKNGWVEWDDSWLIHSTGYARMADGDPLYVIVILTQGLHSLDDGVELIESIATPIHQAFGA